PLRRHAQPVEPGPHARRLVRRRRRGGRRGSGAAGARHRRRRLDPQAGRLVRDLRPQGFVGPDSRLSIERGVEPLARWADDADREGRGADDERVRRARRARSVLAAGDEGRLREGAHGKPQRATRRVEREAWRRACGRSRGERRDREGRARLSRARLQGRNGRAHVALALRLLADDLPRWHRRAPRALCRPSLRRRDRAGRLRRVRSRGPLGAAPPGDRLTMKVGVNLLNWGPGVSPESLVRWTALVEALGYHLVMISDHVAPTPDVAAKYPPPIYDPFTTLGWLAAATRTIELGT